MDAVTLYKKKLVEDLGQVATEQNTTTEALLNKTVSQFLYKTALEKMKSETAAFEQMHTQLVASYMGQFVAIHNGELLDHDPDLSVLRSRVRSRFGRMPILFRQVTGEMERPKILVRRPRLTFTNL